MYRRCITCKSDTTEESFMTYLKQHILAEFPKYEELYVISEKGSHSNRDLMVTCSVGLEDFLKQVLTTTSRFLKHHYVSKRQARAFKEKKANVNETAAIIQADFAENYNPQYAKEVQKPFFVKNYTTIHPFVITLQHQGAPKTIYSVVISNEMQHVTNTCYAFQKMVLNWLQTEYPHITHIEYFSDGCGAQYKNYKNMANLRHHKKDFNLSAAHNFFTSYHGKGSCDAIGGVVKGTVRRAAMAGKIIQRPEEFFRYVKDKIPKIKSFYVTSDKIEQLIEEAKLEDRYATAQKIIHIREIHRVEACMQIYEITDDNEHCAVLQNDDQEIPFQEHEVEIGDWVAGVYDGNWYYGQIRKVLTDLEELSVRYFKEPAGVKATFSTLEKAHTYVPWCQVIMKVPAPSRVKSRFYKFDDDTNKKVIAKFERMQ